MRKITAFLLGITMTLVFTLTIIAQNNLDIPLKRPKTDTIIIKPVSLDIQNLNKIESLIKPKEKSFISEWGILIVALVALIGSVVTSLLGNRRSRLNTENQIKSSERNIILQLSSNKELEFEKKKLELHHKNLNEVKENVAKFIKEAQKLNQIIHDLKSIDKTKPVKEMPKPNDYNPYIDRVLVNLTNWKEKPFNYGDALREDIEELRVPLTDLYYSIKISLDSSPNQKKLEELLDDYMKISLFREDLFEITPESDYFDKTAKIYHQIKKIIHENYITPE